MKFYTYKNDKEVITESFSDFINYEGWLLCHEDNSYLEDGYKLYDFNAYNAEQFVKHSEVVDMLKNYYCCNVVADVYITHYMDDTYYSYREYGFFIVKKDKIERFVSCDFADGLKEGIDFCCKQAEEYKAK